MALNSSETFVHTDELKAVLIWTMASMSVIACLSNTLVIVTILGTKSLRSTSSAFLLNLAICDFFVGIVMMPIIINNIHGDEWVLSEYACTGIGVLNHLLQSGSIYTVTAISMDRYITIIHCLKYSSWSKCTYSFLVLLIVWGLSISLTLPTLSSNYVYMTFDETRFMCIPNWKNKGHVILASCIFQYALPVIVMTFCYLKIIGVARCHARKISDMTKQINKTITDREKSFGTEMVGSINKISMVSYPIGKTNRTRDNKFAQIPHRESDKNLSRFEREARAALRLVGLVLSFIVCWTSYLVVNCIRSYSISIENVPSWLPPISMWLTTFHSTINPFLYAIMSKRFRFAIKRLFSKWFHYIVRVEQVTNLSELRSKCYETDNDIRTMSVFPVRRIKRMKPIKEDNTGPNNVVVLSSIESKDDKTDKPVHSNIHRNNEFEKTGEEKSNDTDQQLYLSVPKKSFVNGKGSVCIQTDNGETISTRIIQVDEKREASTSDKNTKIRICVDLTT